MTTNFGEWTWCHCWVPLHGAIVLCYGGGRGSGAIAGAIVVCYGLGGRVTAGGDDQLCGGWGVDVVPLQGAIVVCYGLAGG